ncbi:response regulator transcription factor [Streptomyces sp. NPDC047108]|uniref:response regulator transcription factor n=1 Tax=Streptomyces sp. NPDC047108 TaxID=3155025 RepID=UPI0033DB74CF
MVIRAVVADDQGMVRSGFVNLLATQDDIEVVGEAEDGEEAVRIVAEQRPDVALLDIRMPRMNGIEAARAILAPPAGASGGPEAPAPCDGTKVLMLTTFGLDEYVYDALSAGASGFLLKDATFAELLHAVRVVADGNALLAPEVTERLIADFVRRRTPRPRAASPGDLTAREVEVLTLIGQGLSNGEIAEQLMISENTLKTHINRLFGKMELRDRAQAVILAYELRLVVPGPTA